MVSPIVTGLAARGIKLGNWYENIADALSVMTDASRQAKNDQLYNNLMVYSTKILQMNF